MIFIFNSSIIYGKTYSGKVVPLIESTINSGTDADFNGIIKYVAAVGAILKPEITDMKGNVLIPGSPLLILDPQYLQYMVKFNQQGVLIAKDNLANAQINLNRNKELIKGHEISEKEYQNYLNTYNVIKNNLYQAQSRLSQSKQFLRGCFLTAPFECIVDQVLLPAGMAANQPPTIVVSQLNPIGIKVVISREVANSIKPESIIKIYSMRKEKPVGILRGKNILKSDGIIFQIENRPKYGDVIEIDGKKLPVIKEIASVSYFDHSRKLLSVPAKAIFVDKDGKYLWKGVGIKNMQSSRGIKSIFKVSKVYIELANKKKYVDGNRDIVAINANSKLSEFDIVITQQNNLINNPTPKGGELNPLMGLKNNSLIYFSPERYIFMPGDTVKVVIE